MKRTLKLPSFSKSAGVPKKLSLVDKPEANLGARNDLPFGIAFCLASLFLAALGYAGSQWVLPSILGSIKQETETVAFEITEGETIEEMEEVRVVKALFQSTPPIVPVPHLGIPSVEILSMDLMEPLASVHEQIPSELAETLESALLPFPEARLVDPTPKKRTAQPSQRRASKPAAKPSRSNRVVTKPKPTKRSARLVHRVSPSYPVSARRSGEEGRVVVMITIGVNGKVSRASVSTSSGSRVLDQAALTAVKKWKFQPAMVSGRAVPAQVTAPVVFNLN